MLMNLKQKCFYEAIKIGTLIVEHFIQYDCSNEIEYILRYAVLSWLSFSIQKLTLFSFSVRTNHFYLAYFRFEKGGRISVCVLLVT